MQLSPAELFRITVTAYNPSHLLYGQNSSLRLNTASHSELDLGPVIRDVNNFSQLSLELCWRVRLRTSENVSAINYYGTISQSGRFPTHNLVFLIMLWRFEKTSFFPLLHRRLWWHKERPFSNTQLHFRRAASCRYSVLRKKNEKTTKKIFNAVCNTVLYFFTQVGCMPWFASMWRADDQ